MQQVTITIGRNIGSKPMSDFMWAAFKEIIKVYLEESFDSKGTNLVEVHEGTGSRAGIEETSAKLTVATSFLNVTQKQLHQLTMQLATIAAIYGQDAIAMTVGESTLVYPSNVEQSVVIGL